MYDEMMDLEKFESVGTSESHELFEAIRRDGERELMRPMGSLWWSGVTAGVMMGASVLGKAALGAGLPEAPWASLVSSLGYTLGFLIVVMGHMQLFTENTITTLLPLLQHKTPTILWRTARLWSVVFAANMVGALLVAAMLTSGALSPEVHAEVLALSDHATRHGFGHTFALGVPAGLLIAAMVWMGRKAGAAKFWVIVVMTWLIAAGHFAHVIAGSIEVFALVWARGAGELSRVWTFIAPALLGNVMGGSLLFAMLSYAQVKEELDPEVTSEAAEPD
jgi:formate/nitrite transporter FocA (FNT family)